MSFKIAVVGCGGHSCNVHGPSCRRYAQENPDTVLAGCCDLDEERAKRYQEQFGFQRYYTDVDRMLDQEKPDAVCVIVPEHLIGRMAAKVMRKGYPVMMEKPPGLTKEETLELLKTARETGVIHQVAFNRRFMPLVSLLKERLREVPQGELQTIFYEFYRYDRRESTFETTAIHGIDVVKDIVGSDYRQVRFTYQELPSLGENIANIMLECFFENGIYGQIHFCPCTGAVADRVAVNALDRSFFVETPIWNGCDVPGRLREIYRGETVCDLSGDELGWGEELYATNGFFQESRTFFDHVREGAMCRVDIGSALQSVEIAQCIRDRRPLYQKGDSQDAATKG